MDTFLELLAEYDSSPGQKSVDHGLVHSQGSVQEPSTLMWSSPSASSTSRLSSQITHTSDTSETPPFTDENCISMSEFVTTPFPNWNLRGDEPSPPTYRFVEASHSRIPPANGVDMLLISPISVNLPLHTSQLVHSVPRGHQTRYDIAFQEEEYLSNFSASRRRMKKNGKMKTKSQAASQRIQVDQALLQDAFTARSCHPDEHLRALLDRILESEFLQNHQQEPTSDSLEGYTFLSDIPMHAGVPDGSIYLAFIEQSANRCLMCGNVKDCISRALGCVRRHLDHRPYHCPGSLGDCRKCQGR